MSAEPLPLPRTTASPGLELEELRWLTWAAGRVGAAHTLTALAQAIEALLVRFPQFEGRTLYLEEPGTAALRLLYAPGLTDEERELAESTARERHPGWVVRNGSVLSIPHSVDAEDDLPSRIMLRRTVARSRLWVPVTHEGRTYGAFGLSSARTNAFGDRDRELLCFLAALAGSCCARIHAAAAVDARVGLDERAQSLAERSDRLGRTVDRQRALLELSTELVRTRSRRELFELMERRLVQVLGVDRVSVAERREGEGGYRVELIYEPPGAGLGAPTERAPAEPLLAPTREVVSRELTGSSIERAFATGRPVTTREHAATAFADWAFLHERRACRHFVIVPLAGPDGVTGTLNLGFAREAPVTEEEVRWCDQVGAMIGAHLSTYEARDQLEALNAALESRVKARTQELTESEHRFARLFEHAPQAMLMVDETGRIRQVNRRASELFRYPEDELVGLPVSTLVPIPMREKHATWMRDFRGPAAPMAGGRVVGAVRRDGSAFSAEIGLVPLEVGGQATVLVGVADVTERLAAQEGVARSLREKETLLQEIHHRVKNNLQIVASLLHLQSGLASSASARDILKESTFRVRSMALVHEHLYGVDSLASIDFGAYVRRLVEIVRGGYGQEARVETRVAPVDVTMDVAVPLGLVLNELLTNALKYGLRGDRANTDRGWDVLVEVTRRDQWLRVVIHDSGPGLEVSFDAAPAATLGLRLVHSLGRQLRARVTATSEAGARVQVEVPLPPRGVAPVARPKR